MTTRSLCAILFLAFTALLGNTQTPKQFELSKRVATRLQAIINQYESEKNRPEALRQLEELLPRARQGATLDGYCLPSKG